MLGLGLDRATMAYGFAHFGKISFWYASELLFAYYLSEICGLPSTQMGVVLALSFLFGAAADLAVSHALRKPLQQVAAAVRMQAWGALACSLTLLALMLGIYVPGDWRLPFALLFSAAFRLSYVFFDLPQNVMLSIATGSADARSRIASLRIFFSSSGSLLVAASLVPLMSERSGLPVALRFIVLAVLLSLLALAGALALLRSGLSWARSHAGNATITVTPPPGFSLRFPTLLWLNIAMSFFITMLVSSFGKMAPFYTTYVLQSAPWGGYVLPSASLGAALSQPAWTWLAMRIGRGRMLLAGALLLALAALGFWRGAHAPLVAGLCAFGIGASSSGMGMTLWAAFGDMVARDRRIAAGVAYGTLTAALKVALAIGSLGLGAIMSLLDYRGAEAGRLVGLMSLPSAAAGLLVILVLAWSHRLSRNSGAASA